MSRRRWLVVAAALVLGLGLAAVGSTGHSERTARGAGHPTPASELIDFSLVLHQRDAAIDRYLGGLTDPSSPLYGHYLPPAEFGRRFGISRTALRALGHSLRTSGLRVIRSYPQRTSIRIRGTAATVRRVFGVDLRDYTTPAGIAYHAPGTHASIPRALSHWVVGVDGLDTRPTLRPMVESGLLTPFDGRNIYHVKPLLDVQFKGQGQTIGVLSIDRYSEKNVAHFVQHFGLPPSKPLLSAYTVSKGTDLSTDETDMDIEIIRSVAPQAHIIDYQFDNSLDDLANAISTVVAQGKTRIVTGSIGVCDGPKGEKTALDKTSRKHVDDALRTAAAAGFSFFFSTGDDGSKGCTRWHDAKNNRVQFPSDSRYAVAVGGTQILTVEGGGWEHRAWDGGGGGLSPLDARPPWQKAFDLDLLIGGTRQVPDVSAAARDWWIWTTKKGKTGSWNGGGTSASSPFMAASMLLVQQYMQAHNAGPLCFASPLLYALAEPQGWEFLPFLDVTDGTNGFPARTGWDYATGLGTPNVTNLAVDAVTYRTAHPLPAGPGACSSLVPKN